MRFWKNILFEAAVISICSLGVGFTLQSCANNPTPVVAVSQTAMKVEQTGSVLLKAAQDAHQILNPSSGAPLLSTAQLDQVALVCDKLGRLGTSLAAGLNAYEAAKAAGRDTAALAAAIQGLVKSASDALTTIGTYIPHGTVATIDQIVTEALGLYAQISATAL